MSTEGRLVRPRLRFERNFTQLPNEWLRDERLSFKARGLRDMLMSHDAGWYVTIKNLAASGPDGRASVQAAVQELQDTGYLTREQTRDNRGRLAHVWWELHDPFEEKLSTGRQEKPRSEPLAGFPSAGNPPADKPSAENRPTKEEHIKEHLPIELKKPTIDAGANNSDALPGGSHSDASELRPSEYSRLMALNCPGRRAGKHHVYNTLSQNCEWCGIRNPDCHDVPALPVAVS